MSFDITGQLNIRLASGAIRSIANEINSGLRSSGVGAINIPVKADTSSIKSLSSELDTANSSVLKFAQQSGIALKRFAAFTLAAAPVMALGSAFRNAASEALSFDKEMLRLRQVSMDVGGEVKSISAEVTRLSVNFGVSSQDLIKTAVILKQANLSITETKIALEAMAKSALAPNFDSMAQTTEGAIAVMNQFKIESKDLEQALGSMNAVAGEFAVEAGDLIEVVRRTGGAFKASGGDLNELMAIFTSVRQTTRESAESISTGLRTIFTRLQRNDTVNQLKSIGVNLRYTRLEAEQMGNIKLEDQFVGAYEAVIRLSQALAQIPQSDSRFASITEELGGYRQIGKVIPMLKEVAVSERALMVAEAGRASLQTNAAQAADSYGNKLTKLGESYTAFGRTIMDTSTFKGAFSGFESLAKSILGVIEAARPLLPLLTAIGSVKLAFTALPFLREAVSGASHFSSSPTVSKKRFSAGGIVPGSGNTDSVPTDLRPGSFVVRKSSVVKYGREAMSTLANGYAKGGEVSAMVMPGEFIFTPAQASRIGYSNLSAINSGSTKKLAKGTPPKSGSAIGDFLKRIIGIDDDSMARRKLSSMFPVDKTIRPVNSKAEDSLSVTTKKIQEENLRKTIEINKDKKVRSLLDRITEEAVEKNNLAGMMNILPEIKGSRTMAALSKRPREIGHQTYGYAHTKSRSNRIALTEHAFKGSKSQPVRTAGHELIHLIDRHAGISRLRGLDGDTAPYSTVKNTNFLSATEGSQTNDQVKKIFEILKSHNVELFNRFGKHAPTEVLAHTMTDSRDGPSHKTKKIAELLPLESRDNFYLEVKKLEETFRTEVGSLGGFEQKVANKDDDTTSSKIDQSSSLQNNATSQAPNQPTAPSKPPGKPTRPSIHSNTGIPSVEQGRKLSKWLNRLSNRPTVPPDFLGEQAGKPTRPSIHSNTGIPSVEQRSKLSKWLNRSSNKPTAPPDFLGEQDGPSQQTTPPTTSNAGGQDAQNQIGKLKSKAKLAFPLRLPRRSDTVVPYPSLSLRSASSRGFKNKHSFSRHFNSYFNMSTADENPGPDPATTAKIEAQNQQTTPPTTSNAGGGQPPKPPSNLPSTTQMPEDDGPPRDSSSVESNRKKMVSPSVRKLAVSHGIDVDTIKGSGTSGAVTNNDVYTAAGVPHPPPTKKKVVKPVPDLIHDRAKALNFENPKERINEFDSIIEKSSDGNDLSTAKITKKLNSQETINLLSEMGRSIDFGEVDQLERSILREKLNNTQLSSEDAGKESKRERSSIYNSAYEMRRAQDTKENESSIKHQATSRGSDIKKLSTYARRANSLQERAELGSDPAAKEQREIVLKKMEEAKTKVAASEGIDPGAIYSITSSGQYEISDSIKPFLKKLSSELASLGSAAAENISEANKLIEEHKKKLGNIKATFTKDARGRQDINFLGIETDKDPAVLKKNSSDAPPYLRTEVQRDRYYTKELGQVKASKNKVGFGASVTEELKQEDFVNLLSDIGTADYKKLLKKSIYKSLQTTRPDLEDKDRKTLAREKTESLIGQAKTFDKTKYDERYFASKQKEYSHRSDAIKNLPETIAKINNLKDFANTDPNVGPELIKAMSNLENTFLEINRETGLKTEQYISTVDDGQTKKLSVRDSAKGVLSQTSQYNQTMAKSYESQALEKKEDAQKQLKNFDGMNASFIQDNSGKKGIRFGGDSGRYGAGPPEAPPPPPPPPPIGPSDNNGLTLAQLRQNRISEKMTKIDPSGRGEGLSEITKAVVIEEETNKLRREYANGMAQIIMKERQINSLEAARAIAIEEFNKNLHNQTLVTARTDVFGRQVVNAKVSDQSSRPPSGSYGSLVAEEYKSIIKKIDPKDKGGLSDISKQRSMEEAETNIKKMYLQTISAQVKKTHQLTSIDDALIIAEEMRIIAMDENTKVVRKGNKIFDQQMLDSGATGKNSIRDIVRSSFESLKKTFLNFDTAIAGISVAAAYLGDAISKSAGSVEGSVQANNDSSYKEKKALGGSITGAGTGIASGAFAGFTVGGPGSTTSLVLGSLGGVVGGLAGFMSALKEAEIEISNIKIAEAVKKSNEYLTNFASGTVNFNAGRIREHENVVDKELPLRAMNELSTLGIPIYSANALKDQMLSSRKEITTQQAPAKMDALTKIIEDRAKKEVSNGANMNDEKRKQAFQDVLMENGGFGRSQLGQVASATGQDANLLSSKLFEMFKRIADNEVIRNKQEQSSFKINQSAVLFGNLSTALEISTGKLMEMSAASKNVSDVMDSNVGPFMGSGLASSLRQPFGSGREDFVEAIKTITSLTGNSDEAVKQADTVTMAGTLLPSIIAVIRSQPVANLAKGENFSIQVGDALQKALSAKGMDQGVSSSIVGMIQGQLGEEDFSKTMRESGQDMSKMVDALLKPVIEPLTRNSEKMSKMMDDRAKDFADQIADMARRTRQKGEMMDSANDAEIAAVRNKVQVSAKRGQISEGAAEFDVFNLALRQQQLRQTRLTNFGNGNAFPNQQAVADTQNPNKIFDAVQEVVLKIKTAERNVDQLSKGNNTNASNQAITELANLKSRAADLNQALKNLTDASERNAAAQEKLSKIQNEREGRQSLGMRYATSNIEGRAEIAKSFSLLSSAVNAGTAASFTARDQNQIFSLLSSLSPQMRLPGLGGGTVKDTTSKLLETTFGGAFNLDPQTAAMEKALENFVQQNYEIASRAAQLQVDSQTNLMSELFSRLENSQTKFLSELAKINKETAEIMKETLILRASEEVLKLEKGGGELSMLGEVGVKNNEQFDILKALTINPKSNSNLKEMINQKNIEASLVNLQKNVMSKDALEIFSRSMTEAAGNEDISTVKNSSAGLVSRQFESMGLSGSLMEQTTKAFNREINNLQGGTFNNRSEDVKGALQAALKYAFAYEIAGTTRKADSAKEKLISGDTKIDPKIIDSIADKSKTEFGNLKFADLESTIRAVESLGGTFEKFNNQLDAAREKLKNLTQPDKKANGGLVKFFNKGGWGSGGSTTSHEADTVNARIDPNEFVVSAGPAQRNRGLLEKINGGGLVRMANGGDVDEIYNNLSQAKSILSREGKMVGGDNEISEAKKLARINSAAMFLVQLKDMPGVAREKLVDDQIKILKDGPENPFQQGIDDALLKIKEKRESQKIFGKKMEAFEENKKAPAFPEMLIFAKKLYDNQKISAVGKALSPIAIANHTRSNPEEIFHQIPEKGFEFFLRADASDLEIKNAITALKNKEINIQEGLNNINPIYSNLSNAASGDPKLVLAQNIYDHFASLDKKHYTSTQVKEHRKDPDFKRDIQGRQRNNAEIRTHLYRNDVDKYFEENVWKKSIDALLPDANTFMGDSNKIFLETRNLKMPGKPDAFDYEDSIKKIIEAQLTEAKKENNAGMFKAAQDREGKVAVRKNVFSTPENKLNDYVGRIDPVNFGKGAMLNVIAGQNLARQAELFNGLNPALQAKYLEPLKGSIRKNGLDEKQQKEIGFSGNIVDFSKNLTSEEIAVYARDKNKFSLLQRAYLEVMMEKNAPVPKGVDKKEDAFSEAEKYAYLISLESQAKTKAYNQVQDKKNHAGLNRMGRFLSANPGLINARMSTAEEKGAEAYANEAALIEMVMSYFGTPTKVPSVFPVFKNKSLIGGKPADAGVQLKKPKIFGANEAGEMGGGKPMGVPLPPAAPPVAAPADPAIKPEEIKPVPIPEANGGLIKFASGGLVPGVGNTDSVRANLPVGSYVIRKSSVNKLGADTLTSLPHMATGGVVPAMVMPGEHIFTPDESSKIGKGKLDYINQNGKLPGYFYGGDVPGGQPGGKKVNAQGAAVFGGGVPNQNGQWVFMPNGANPWAVGMPMNQGVMQNKAMPFGGNANAGAIPLNAGPQNQMGVEQEFQQAMDVNKIDLSRLALADKKTEYYQLRNKLVKSRIRSKEDVDKFKKLHAELTNPFVAQADTALRMFSVQQALAEFQDSPKDFLESAKSHRQKMLDPKANYKDRLVAKENYEEYVLAARSIPPQALQAAMGWGKKKPLQVAIPEEKNQPKNDIVEKEWERRREGVVAHNAKMNEKYPKISGAEAVAAHNAKMNEKYPSKISGAEAVAAHNAKMNEKYPPKISGAEAVKEHNEKVIEAQKKPRPDVEINHQQMRLITARENFLRTGDPNFINEYKKIASEGIVDRDAPDAQTVDRIRFFREQDALGDEKHKYALASANEGREEIRDPGGVKRKAAQKKLDDEQQAEKLKKFYQMKQKRDKDWEDKFLIGDQKKLNEMRQAILEKNKEYKEYKANKASGGIITGYGSGDHVPALLEPGEAVIPRREVQKFANGGIVGGIQGFANGGMAQGGGPELLDVAAKFNQAATQISQGLSGFSTSVSTFNGAVASFGTFVDKFDEAVGKIPGQIELSGANEISVNLMGQDSIVKAVTEAIGPMIAEAIRANQPVEQRSQ